MASEFVPIPVEPWRVLRAGVTPARLCVWAIRKAKAGQPEQAARLLDAAKALMLGGSRG